MKKMRVLVAPLDWGLGHATRCIPVIAALKQAGFEVLIAAEGACARLLKEEFPDLGLIPLKGYGLSYSAIMPAWLKIFLQIPKIVWRIVAEHHQLRKIVDKYGIGLVISDNRFGLWNKKVKTVYITHQVMIKCPDVLRIFEPLLYSMHRRIIEKYDHCWIPDYEGTENLSGDLSHRYALPRNATFIQPLSRFTGTGLSRENFEYELCAIISGPEPARTEFENKVMSRRKHVNGRMIVIRGKPGEQQDEQQGNIRIVSHLNAKDLARVIAASRFVVCRAGYSGIMDLAALKKDALLIPTPGQTEQEYLARYLSAKKIFSSCIQERFDLKTLMPENGASVNNLPPHWDNTRLRECVDGLNSVYNIPA